MLQWVAFGVASEGPVLGRGAANLGSRSDVAATRLSSSDRVDQACVYLEIVRTLWVFDITMHRR